LIEGEEFVKANELLEEINGERLRYFHLHSGMKLENMLTNMIMQVPQENSDKYLTNK
jgi:hypothetical protein